MDFLPNELMVKILQNLKQSDLENSVDVCDHWRDLIYDGIGVQRCIGVIHPGFKGISKLPKLMEFKEIEEIGMNYCITGDIIDEEEIPNYRSAHLIKKMSFVGLIVEETFKTLTNPLNNLTSPSFELKTLNNFQFSSGLQFPNLKQFMLSDLFSKTMDLEDDDNLWKNFISIYLESYFPKLQVLHLFSIPLLTADEGKIMVDTLLVFLDKHKKTLQKFGLIVTNNFLQLGNEIPEIPQVHMTNQLQLQNFQYVSSDINSQVHQELNGILKTQTNLKAYMDVLVPIDPNLIQQNSSTLVTIDLFVFINSDPDYLVDFDLFKNCTALKYVTIYGYGRITNAKCLPLSLESIRIMHFRIDSKDASDLMTMKWTHSLKSLELHNIKVHETFGVNFDAICTLLKQKTIARVLISKGLNKTSFDAAKLTLNNGTDLPGLARRILERTDIDEIQFGLDIDKNYVFMDWTQLERKLYIPEESNQMYIDGGGLGSNFRLNSMIF